MEGDGVRPLIEVTRENATPLQSMYLRYSRQPEGHQGKVRYIVPEGLIEYLDLLEESPQPTKQTIRGYKVRTVQQFLDPKDSGERRQAIADVIARSLRKSKDE